MFIAKLQMPVVTNEEVPKVLIYNESRSIEHQTPVTPELEKLFGEKKRVYAKCKLTPKGVIEINGLVKDQKW